MPPTMPISSRMVCKCPPLLCGTFLPAACQLGSPLVRAWCCCQVTCADLKSDCKDTPLAYVCMSASQARLHNADAYSIRMEHRHSQKRIPIRALPRFSLCGAARYSLWCGQRVACTQSLSTGSQSLHLANSRRVGKLALGVSALGSKPTHNPLLLSSSKSVDLIWDNILMICC